MYELFNGDTDEMFQLGMIKSVQASNPYVGDENMHATIPKQSIGSGTTSKTLTERVRKRVYNDKFNDDLSPTKQKQAGKVCVGLATNNPRYTTVIDDAPPDMLSQDLYGHTSKCAAHANTPPMKKSRKKKKESPIPSDSSDSKD